MASRYWVGGGSSTNWNATSNTNWSATSGGANNASVPGSSDDVFFNGSSGSGNSVLSANITINSIDFTGFTGTFTHNAFQLNIAGNGVTAKWASGMTYTPANSQSAIVRFTGTSGTNLFTSAGKLFSAVDQVGAGGTTQLQDALSVTSGSFPLLQLTAGTLDANGFAVTTGFFNSTNSNTRALLLGGGLWTLNGSSTVWNTGTITNLTYTKGASDLYIPGITGDPTLFVTGAITHNRLTVSTASRTTIWSLQISAATFTDLTFNSSMNIILSGTLAVTNPFTWTGDGTHWNRISSSAIGTARTITTASGTVRFDYCVLQNITGAGGATFLATNSIDNGGNTNITIIPPKSPMARSQIGI